MSNFKGRTVYYTPKKKHITSDEAYERLPSEIRKALQEAVQPWCAIWAYKTYKKLGSRSVIDAIKAGDRNFIKKGWIVKRGRGVTIPSPCVEMNVPILYANW